MDELVALIEGARKLAAELGVKIKEFKAGAEKNVIKEGELAEKEAVLVEGLKKLEIELLAVSHITDVEAQRRENQRVINEHEKANTEKKNALDAQARTLDERRSKLDAERANLDQEWGSYRDAMSQLEKDKATYKEDVLKGLGIRV